MSGYNYFMSTITMKAWAKINLTLDVLNKRPDGYHNLVSVMQSICLYDTLLIRKTSTAVSSGNLEIEIKTDCYGLPTDESNLIYKAAKSILTAYDLRCGISVELQKNIPVAAGLAGGSSNCAATLLGLNTLLELNIPQERLFEMGRNLGADVPFCLMSNIEPSGSGTALAEGIGEKLTPLPSHPDIWIVLAHLPIPVSTKEIFSRRSHTVQQNRNAQTNRNIQQPKTFRLHLPSAKKQQTKKKSPEMVKAFASGNINKIADNLSNDLTALATDMHPEIFDLITAFNTQNPLGVNMSGSGPTVFAYFLTEFDALKAQEHIRQQFISCDVFCTKPKTCLY
ncbi:MAG: 4-(cytidine 5'-diphospho)-2-C-methyl-D-erythritol kinase [Defluviitaleaceae bacterium]|nr:4-(cytidine 5'-diphospho)-2-C-methyl-D-erythritol kinase [Defluviitaleaceae bacterium]